MSVTVFGRDIEWYVPVLTAVCIGYIICVVDQRHPFEPTRTLALDGPTLNNLLLHVLMYIPSLGWGIFQRSFGVRSFIEAVAVSTLFPWLISLAFLSQGYFIMIAAGTGSQLGGTLFPLRRSIPWIEYGIFVYFVGLVLGIVGRRVHRYISNPT